HRLDVLDQWGERALVGPRGRVADRLPPGRPYLEGVGRGGVERVGDVDLAAGAEQPGERLAGPVEPARQVQVPAAGEAQAAPGRRVHAAAVPVGPRPGAV